MTRNSQARAAGSGQRAAGSGQRATGSGQRAAGNGQRATKLRRWREYLPDNRRDWCIWILTLAGACAFSIWVGYPSKVLPPPNGGLVVDPNELDFGEAWEDRAFPWKFTIHNPTTTGVTIDRFWNSCSCAAVKPDSMTVPAGGNLQLALTLDLRAAFWEKPGSSEVEAKISKRLFDAEIIPELADGPTRSQAWKIKGRVARVLTASPPFLELNEGFVCGEPFPLQKVKVTAQVPLLAIMAKCSIGSGHNVCARRVAPESNDWEVETALSPDLPAGPFKFDLMLEPVAAGGQRLPAQVVPVRGTVWQSVRAFPSTLLLGLNDVGATIEETVTLRSLIKAPFQVVGPPICPDTDTQVRELAWRGSQDLNYVIRQRIARAGKHESAVQFRIRSQNREFDLELRVAYHGKPK